MAMKRCPDCGEKYSDTYKYCPFCEEEEVLRKGKDRGGRRARQSRHFSVLTPILVVLILIMAGILLFLLRDDKSPTGPKDPVTPQPGVVTPVQPDDSAEKDPSEPGETEGPEDNSDPGVMPDEPDTTTPNTPNTPTTPTAPSTTTGSIATVVNAATGVNVRPDPSTSGTPVASLKNGDEVKVVKDAGNGWYEITFSGPGGRDTTGYMKGEFLSTTAGTSSAGTSSTTTGKTGTTTGTTGSTAATSGNLKTGNGKVVNAGGGVFVRSGPGKSYDSIATLTNGSDVKIVSSAGDGWYQITFSGNGGKTTTGYMKGDYLANS